MRWTPILGWALLGLGWPLVFVLPQAAGQAPEVTFCQQQGAVRISIGNRPVASYVYDDARIPRPYLCNVRSPGGIPVTRHHPPREGVDPTDHASLHPGIWMAFGDLGGADNWRNRDRVLHGGFVEKPDGGPGRGTFAVRNLYLKKDDPAKLLCREVCRLTVLVRPSGYLLVWDSAFWPVAEGLQRRPAFSGRTGWSGRLAMAEAMGPTQRAASLRNHRLSTGWEKIDGRWSVKRPPQRGLSRRLAAYRA